MASLGRHGRQHPGSSLLPQRKGCRGARASLESGAWEETDAALRKAKKADASLFF